MKRILVTMPDELHEELKELAHRRRTTMSRLMRVAVETVYEDELDAISGEMGLEDFLDDPDRGISVEELDARRRSAVQSKV
jgi:predicted transcriptional regulator